MTRTEGLVRPPYLLDVAPATAPGLHLPHHALRRPAPSAAGRGHVIAVNNHGSFSAGCRCFDIDHEVLATAMMVVNGRAIKDAGNNNNNNNNNNISTSASSSRVRVCASQPPLPPPSGLRMENAVRVRGGSETGAVRGGRHRARRRPLKSFFAPALVWIVAAWTEYDLWWRQGSAAAASAAASSVESYTSHFRFGRGRAAETIVKSGGSYRGHFVCFHVLLCLALLSHVAVTVADPGFLPRENHAPGVERAREPQLWCDRCEGYKPPRAHHCRRCGACVARMDHHCVYVANCIGAGNQKQLILLLLYSAACAAHTSFLYFRSCLSHGSWGGDVTSGFVNVSEGSFGRWGSFSMASGLLLPMFPLLVFAWLAVLLTVQLHGIGVGAGIVDRLQAAAREDLVAEKAGVLSSEVAEEPRGRERRLGWSQVAPAPKGALASGSSPFADLNRGVGHGQLQNTAASTSGKESLHRACPPAAAAASSTFFDERFQTAVDLPRGPLDRASNDGEISGALKTASCFCPKLWRTLRQELLGEGPWIMWFVPTPAVS